MKTPITDAEAKRVRINEDELTEPVSANFARRLELICDKFARSVRDYQCGHKPNYDGGECEACQALHEYDALAAQPNIRS